MTSFRLCVASMACVAGLLAASPASAQGGRVTASINVGAQGSSGDFTYRLTPSILTRMQSARTILREGAGSPGDLISVPENILHYFTLMEDRKVVAVRIFVTTEGWVPIYA